MCVSSVGFARGVLRGVVVEDVEQTDAVTMYNVFYRTSIGHARHVKTRSDNGLRIWIFSQKLPFSVGEKMFQRQI